MVMLREVDIKEAVEVDMDVVTNEDMEDGGGRALTLSNFGEIGHVSRFYSKPRDLYGYFYITGHLTYDYLDLFKKWEKIRHIETWCMQSHEKIRRRMRRLMSG